MKRIVITGGPCAGKTTAVAALRQSMGDRVVCVREAATVLLEGGFPVPERRGEGWRTAFQRAIIGLQLSLEALGEAEAASSGAEVIVLDRGILDGAAYFPGGVSELCRRFDFRLAFLTSRYDAVLHLESLATGDPTSYGIQGNRYRVEDVQEASRIELATRRAWRNHPSWHFVGHCGSMQGKFEVVQGLVDGIVRGVKAAA